MKKKYYECTKTKTIISQFSVQTQHYSTEKVESTKVKDTEAVVPANKKICNLLKSNSKKGDKGRLPAYKLALLQ